MCEIPHAMLIALMNIDTEACDREHRHIVKITDNIVGSCQVKHILPTGAVLQPSSFEML